MHVTYLFLENEKIKIVIIRKRDSDSFMKKIVKFLLLLTISAFMVGCSNSIDKNVTTNSATSNTQSDNENDILDNKKTDDGLVDVWLTETIYNVSDDEEEISESYKYDEKGNLLDKIIYKNGKEYKRSAYTYNEQGDIIVDRYFKESVETNKITFEHTYNENGRLLETLKVEYYIKDNNIKIGKESRYIYNYDNNNNIVSLKHEYKSSDTGKYDDCYETNYTYNEKGKIISQERVRNATFDKKITYEYDKNGNIVLYTTVDRDGYKSETSYEYDDDSNLIKEICKNKDKELYTDLYEYNNDGYATKYTRIHDGKESVQEYTYDENGNVININKSNSADNRCTYINIRMTQEQQELLYQEKPYS